MNAIELSPPVLCPELQAIAEQAAKFLEAARARSTRRAYTSDVRDFEEFCVAHGLPFLPSTPEVVVLYITHLASRATVSTIQRRPAATTYAHRQTGYASPASPRKHFEVREVLAGIKRTLGVAQQGAVPLLGDTIRRIVDACTNNVLDLRDRALVLLGFAAGSRHSELASILEVGDLTFSDMGLYIWLRRSKTHQEKTGRVIAISVGEHAETWPVLVLQAQLADPASRCTLRERSQLSPYRRAFA